MRLVALILAPLVLLGSFSSAACAAQAEQNKQIVVAMMEAINDRDLDALDWFVAGNVQRHSDATPAVVVENLEQFKAFLEADFAAVPDSVQTVNRILAEDDLVAVHATYAGTQDGAFGPFPASGQKLAITFIAILRLEEGRIAEIWVEWDNLNILTQLGHFPPPSTGQAAAD